MAFLDDDYHGQPSTQGRLVDSQGNLLSSDSPQMDLPYEQTFSAIIQGMSKSFLAGNFDEALRTNRQNALAMRRDCWLMALLSERIEGTVSRKWTLEVPDPTDPVQVAVRDGMTQIISQIPHFKRILRYLLESIWYGRSAAQLLWHEVEMDLPAVPQAGLFPMGNDREQILQRHLSGGGQLQKGADEETAEPKPQTERRKVTTVRMARPVNGDKINFTWSGTPLIAINASFDSDIRRQGGEIRNSKDLKMAITWDNEKPVLMLTREWRERFLIAVHNPSDSDYFEAERAGAVHGVGARSFIYWVNWLRLDAASWVTDYLDRVGLGFICVKYEAGNVKAKEAAEDVARRWNRKSVLAIPVSPDQMRSSGGIEVVDVPTAGALVAQQIIEHYESQIERYMVGQVMSSGKSADSGMGGTSGPARMAEETKAQKLAADADEIAETLTGSNDEPGLCSTIQRWTWPGTIQKFRVKFKFAESMADPKPKIDNIVALAGAGVEFGQDSARKLTGEPAPKQGEKTFGGKPPAPAPGQPGAPGQPPPGADPNAPDADPDADVTGNEQDAGAGTAPAPQAPAPFLGMNGNGKH